jgi:dolichol-phosphate mannosyltransferase
LQLSVIIPVFNEEANIVRIFERLESAIATLGIKDYEYLFINDGSKDNSAMRVRELSAGDPRIRYINFSRNFGHQVAVTAGIDHCSGERVVIIDGDLQDPPELIPDLYRRMDEGFDVVYAKRIIRKGEGPFKKITASLFYRILSRITSIDIPVDTGDFRIINRKVVDVLKQMPEQQKFIRGQISWIGFRQGFVEFERDGRESGRSGYSIRKMLRLALDGITSFSNFPLKFATIAGFLVSGISFLLMLYALYSRFITRDYEPGWASLMLTILFIGGIQLIGIGIIGEYISRISENVRNRPLYIISDTNLNTRN